MLHQPGLCHTSLGAEAKTSNLTALYRHDSSRPPDTNLRLPREYSNWHSALGIQPQQQLFHLAFVMVNGAA